MSTAAFCFLALKQSQLYAGDSFKGYLILLIDDDVKEPVTSVAVEFSGVEETIWFDGVKQDQRHGASRSLGSQQTLLWSASEEEEAESAALGVGTHTFPFELSTNATLPSSYEDSGANVSLFNGHDFMPKSFHADQRPAIRFAVGALVNGVAVARATQPIRIWQRVVLPPPEPPLAVSQSKTFLLGKHPVEVTASVAHNGNCFVGDGIAVRLTVANNGARKVDDVRLTLGSVVQLNGSGDKETMSRHAALATLTLPSSAVAPGQMWTRDFHLPLPPDASPTIRSKLIQLAYELVIDVNAGMGSTLTASMAVTIWGGSADEWNKKK